MNGAMCGALDALSEPGVSIGIDDRVQAAHFLTSASCTAPRQGGAAAQQIHELSAFRTRQHHDGIAYTATMEWEGPARRARGARRDRDPTGPAVHPDR